MRPDLVVKRGKIVKWHLRKRVVFRVIRHVPGKPTQRARGENRAGVFKHIGHLRAATMFGQQVKPQEWLA